MATEEDVEISNYFKTLFDKIIAFFRNIGPVRFHNIPNNIIDAIENQGDIENCVVKLTFNQRNGTAYTINGDMVFYKNSKYFQAKVIDTIVLDCSLPYYIEDKLSKKELESIALLEDDLNEFYKDKDYKLYSKVPWHELIEQSRQLCAKQIEFTDLTFYTRAHFIDDKNNILSTIKYCKIDNMPLSIFNSLYPNKTVNINPDIY